jgi:hypothetical protein
LEPKQNAAKSIAVLSYSRFGRKLLRILRKGLITCFQCLDALKAGGSIGDDHL